MSRPGVEPALLDRLSFIRFTVFSFEGDVPDETAICRFRNGLIKLKIFDKLLDLLNKRIVPKGLLLREGAVVAAWLRKRTESQTLGGPRIVGGNNVQDVLKESLHPSIRTLKRCLEKNEQKLKKKWRKDIPAMLLITEAKQTRIRIHQSALFNHF